MKITAKHIAFGIGLLVTFVITIIISRILNRRKAMNLATTNANVEAFLYMIRRAEGTAGVDGYRTMFTGKLFDDYSQHPNIKNSANGWSSTAAGAYQFIYATWNSLKSALLLPDFSPASQDAAAVELIREKGALNDVIAGNIDSAVRKLSNTWESFTYGATTQPHKPLATLYGYYQGAGGTIA